MLQESHRYFHQAADVLGLSDRLREILLTPYRVVKVEFEWAQNIQQFRWEKERVDRELGLVMRKAYAAVRGVAEEEGVDMRTAAFVLAIRRVAQAATSRMYVKESIRL